MTIIDEKQAPSVSSVYRMEAGSTGSTRRGVCDRLGAYETAGYSSWDRAVRALLGTLLGTTAWAQTRCAETSSSRRVPDHH